MVLPHRILLAFLICFFLPASSPVPAISLLDDSSRSDQSLTRLIATSPGSKPPSCLNKCDSCTPCQAVQTIQEASDVITDIGSRPPSCHNKCNRCNPCQAVQVPTPDPKRAGRQRAASLDPAPNKPQGEMNTHYSNYKPKGWRCQCGNKLFNP